MINEKDLLIQEEPRKPDRTRRLTLAKTEVNIRTEPGTSQTRAAERTKLRP